MSSRKSTTKSNIYNTEITTSSSSSSTIWSTAIESADYSSAVAINAENVKLSDEQPPETKRMGRSKNIQSSPTIKKEHNDNVDNTDTEEKACDEKSVEEEKSTAEVSKSNDSPARPGRPRKVFNKTAIVTRKSALDANKAETPTRSMRPRRNSVGIPKKYDHDNKKQETDKKSESDTQKSQAEIKKSEVESKKSDIRKLEADKKGESDSKKSEPDNKSKINEGKKIDDESKKSELELKKDEIDITKKPTVEVRKRGRSNLSSSSTPEPSTPTKRKREESDEEPFEKASKQARLDDDRKLSNFESDKFQMDIEIKKEVDESVDENFENLDNSGINLNISDIKIESDNCAPNPTRGRGRGRGRGKGRQLIANDNRRRSGRITNDLRQPENKKTKRTKRAKTKQNESDTSASEDFITANSENNELTTKILLTIDTSNSEDKDIPKISGVSVDIASTSTSSEKAASLSPEMVSEGLSEISVKQFYKKPEFLENNLGIEKDPTLGGIVQEAENVTDKVLEKYTDETGNELEKNQENKSDFSSVARTEQSIAIITKSERQTSSDMENLHENDLSHCLKSSNLIEKSESQGSNLATNIEDSILQSVIKEKEFEKDDSQNSANTNETTSSKKIEQVEKYLHEDATNITTETKMTLNDENEKKPSVSHQSKSNLSGEKLGDKSFKTSNTLVEKVDTSCDGEKENKIDMPRIEKIEISLESHCDNSQMETDDSIADSMNIEKNNKQESEILILGNETENATNTVQEGSLVFDEESLGGNLKNDSVDLGVDHSSFKKEKVNKKLENYGKIKTELDSVDNKEIMSIEKTKSKADAEKNTVTKESSKNSEQDIENKNAEIANVNSESKDNIEEKIEDSEKGTMLLVADENACLKKKMDVEFISKNIDEKFQKRKKLSVMETSDEKTNQKTEKKKKVTETETIFKETTIQKKKKITENSLEMEKKKKSPQPTASTSAISILPASASLQAISTQNQMPQYTSPQIAQITPEKLLDQEKKNLTGTTIDDEVEKSLEEEISHFKISKSLKLIEPDDDRRNLTETPETMRQKERHLKTLGLLTHKAAVQATMDKQRRKKLLQTTAAAKRNTKSLVVGNKDEAIYVIKNNRQSLNSNDAKRSKSGTMTSSSNSGISGHTIGNGGRQSLKMTFQKGRGRQNERSAGSSSQSNVCLEETYYTIQNETQNEGGPNIEAVSHGRKSYNRNHSIDFINQSESNDSSNKKEEKEEILIPEKASSFGIHPGRLCQDQCYYCGGKFGLYDTPCHVAQLKSLERQQKILANEEKLTVDNCLCDACFRHVDKRANVPSYRKRLEAALENENNNSSTNESGGNSEGNKNICFVPDCNNTPSHYLKKKCIRKSIKKILQNFDTSTLAGITPMCNQHYSEILQFLGCALCKKRLGKNHTYHIQQETGKIEKLLSENNVPLQVGNSSAICKLCRYYTNILMKFSRGVKIQKDSDFARAYRKRLLKLNFQPDDDDGGNTDEIDDVDEDGDKKEKQQQPRKQSSETEELSNVNTEISQMDNDFNVEDGVPVISDDSPEVTQDEDLASKLKQILQEDNNKNNSSTKGDNISLVLRSNPNISMRELFPGEEEMGLQMNIPFNSSGSLRTPEGWTRVQTFLQYDEPTRRLWEELQKPYGNQSSFLRHLILLEKYYRNGDLILTNNASSNATVYSQIVQNRLRSYDNTIASTTQALSAKTQSSQQQRSSLSSGDNSKQSYPVTITTKPKTQSQTSIQASTNTNNTKIGSNINVTNNKNAVEILPIAATKTIEGASISSKQQKLLAAANKLIGNNEFSANSDEKAQSKLVESNLPPELISINKNRQAMMSATVGKQQQIQRNQLTQQQHQNQNQKAPSKHNIIVLPDTLTPAERLNSKNWRPTLMPVSSGAHLNQTGPLFETVDGRRLPALVQVQSGGKPYLISIHDYNRMCIIRREKILRDKMLKSGKPSNKTKQQPNNSQHQQGKVPLIPNKILEQNSLFPVGGGSSRSSSNIDSQSQARKKPTLHQQQQNQMAQLKHQQSTSNYVPILPKTVQQQMIQQNHVQILPTTSNSSNFGPMGLPPSFINNSVSILPTIPSMSNVLSNPHSQATSTATSVFNTASTSGNPYLKQMPSLTTSQQMQQNFIQQQIQKAAANMSLAAVASNLNMGGNQLILDNNLLSKIPKSLTVIPQQKSQQGRNSIEDFSV